MEIRLHRRSSQGKAQNALFFFTLVAGTLLLAGCIRYTPSRSELEERYGKDKPSSLNLGGVEEFNSYENNLKQRLQTLLADRSHLLTPGPGGSAYTVGTGDILHVGVFGFEELTSDAEVSHAGSVFLPLIGEFQAGGKDVSSINAELTRRYAHYIRAPKLHVALKSYEANHVSVIGEVAKPGVYPLKRKGQLLTELLSEAGGKNQVAGNRIVLLPASLNNSTTLLQQRYLHNTVQQPALTMVSDGKAGGQVSHTSETTPSVGIEIDLDDILGYTSQAPLLIPLVPGDMIIVPEAGTYEVDGEIMKPGSYKLASRTSAMGAIASAGGFTYAADVNKVEVIRDTGGGRKALVTLDLEEVGLRGGTDLRLRNGDIVRVPSEPVRFFRRQIVNAINSVFNGFSVSQRMGPN